MRAYSGTQELFFENKKFTELNPLFVGRELCVPEKSFGPKIRPYTLIHYVVRGKGAVIKSHGAFSVTQGKAFIIRPGEVVTYTADKDDPWVYYWVGFDGKLSERFFELEDVIDFPEKLMEELFMCYDKDMGEYRAAALLFEMYVELFAEKRVQSNYATRVKDLVKAVYMQDITVESIADSLNLDRRYLTRIFKEKTGFTIQEYIIKTRMNAAQKYLADGFSVEDAAILSGYADPCNFSKMFKRRYGVSPLEWKKQRA